MREIFHRWGGGGLSVIEKVQFQHVEGNYIYREKEIAFTD